MPPNREWINNNNNKINRLGSEIGTCYELPWRCWKFTPGGARSKVTGIFQSPEQCGFLLVIAYWEMLFTRKFFGPVRIV